MAYSIESLKKDHRDFGIELNEIEEIMKSEEINYSNLVHVFKKIFDLWDKHENDEEELFNELENHGLDVPIKKFMFEHSSLKKIREKIISVFNSGSDFKIRECLNNDGVDLINKLRYHMEKEDNIIFSLPFSELIKSGLMVKIKD